MGVGGRAMGERPAVDVDRARHAIGARVDRGVHDRAAAGVPDEHDRLIDRSISADHGRNVLGEADAGAIGGVPTRGRGASRAVTSLARRFEHAGDAVP